MRIFKRGIYSLIACFSAGVIGSLFISAEVGSWYNALNKPSFTPSSWVFAPVWLVLYALMAAALTIVWLKDPMVKEVRGWVPLFFAHLVVNIAWTAFFFGFHVILISLITIIILAITIVLLMIGAWEIDKGATYLLMPYLVWVVFAAILNASIWYMN